MHSAVQKPMSARRPSTTRRRPQLDPRYAVAWSNLSDRLDRPRYGLPEGAPAAEAFAKAREAADRALALAPDLAAAHIARGYLLQSADFDWRGAEAEFRRAVELAPNDGEAKFILGDLLAALGEVERAIELTRQALATDPLRAAWYEQLARISRRSTASMRPSGRSIRPSSCSPLRPASIRSSLFMRSSAAMRRRRSTAALQEPPGIRQDIALAFARQIGSDRAPPMRHSGR